MAVSRAVRVAYAALSSSLAFAIVITRVFHRQFHGQNQVGLSATALSGRGREVFSPKDQDEGFFDVEPPSSEVKIENKNTFVENVENTEPEGRVRVMEDIKRDWAALVKNESESGMREVLEKKSVTSELKSALYALSRAQERLEGHVSSTSTFDESEETEIVLSEETVQSRYTAPVPPLQRRKGIHGGTVIGDGEILRLHAGMETDQLKSFFDLVGYQLDASRFERDSMSGRTYVGAMKSILALKTGSGAFARPRVDDDRIEPSADESLVASEEEEEPLLPDPVPECASVTIQATDLPRDFWGTYLYRWDDEVGPVWTSAGEEGQRNAHFYWATDTHGARWVLDSDLTTENGVSGYSEGPNSSLKYLQEVPQLTPPNSSATETSWVLDSAALQRWVLSLDFTVTCA